MIIDISWPITPAMTAYKDNKVVTFTTIKSFEKDAVRESHIQLGSHTGTHIDAPAHFLQQGHAIEDVSLASTVGSCRVLDMTMVNECITRDDLTPYAINAEEIILFKTSNSALGATQPFDKNFVYVAASAAEYLAEQKVKAVGIDYLGIERNQPHHETHTIVMQHGITIIEGLRLSHVHPGHYFLVCLPLAIQGLEAAPARAILLSALPISEHSFL